MQTEVNSLNDVEKARLTAETVARRSYGKLVAFLAVRTRDMAAAEDALSDAFAAALSEWPRTGCPSNPEAWLLTVARRKSIDSARRKRVAEQATGELQLRTAMAESADLPEAIPDRRLALLFACAHPAIDESVRAPLMLQAILGFDAATIASSFLVAPAAMSKRLVRAKLKIREAGIPFRVPEREELASRLDAVLSAIYAAFGEGWSDAVNAAASRRNLSEEAIFLARLVVELLPDEAEAIGLLALILYAEARREARRDPETGSYIPLADQDTGRWDAELIGEAEALLFRATKRSEMGRYQLEAAIQSAHIYRCRTKCDNWVAVLQLYDGLLAITGSPVVAINRALAVAEAHGPGRGLEALPDLHSGWRLDEYQPYWAARAELASRAGLFDDAQHAYEIAIGLERDPAVRSFLEQRRNETKFR